MSPSQQTAEQWYEEHKTILDQGIETSRSRAAWSPYQESPSAKLHAEGAKAKGLAAFEQQIGKQFSLDQPAIESYIGEEVSPYTRELLGISYPQCNADSLINAAWNAMPQWRDIGPKARLGICMKMLKRLEQQVFENAYATHHTTGQAFMMAFAGSGANSLDRGLEALVYASKAMLDIPEQAHYQRRFAKGEATLKKSYRLHPVGIAIVMSCGSYPAWNAYPAIFANLATGNPVILKPHPDTILPMAITVRACRDVLKEAGLDPNLICLMPESHRSPVAIELLNHPLTAIVDFTGSQQFGHYIEQHYQHLQVYTETAGCNAVLLESVDDLDDVIYALAHSLCLFSSQMCTAPQNIYIPESGIQTSQGNISYSEFAKRLSAQINTLLSDAKTAAAICGALQNDAVLNTLDTLTEQSYDRTATSCITRHSTAYPHPEYSKARTATPMVICTDTTEHDWYNKEHFAPVAFLIACKDKHQALQLATQGVKENGAIASYAYSTDVEFIETIENAWALAGGSVGINLVKHLPLNFTAGFSDYHVTGLNPAGNACLTDLAFVCRRFRITQSKTEYTHN